VASVNLILPFRRSYLYLSFLDEEIKQEIKSLSSFMRTIPLTNDTRNTEDIVCEDEYEAEKLMWILSSNRKEQKLKHAATVGEKEMIVVLDDDSSHSVTMSDEESAHKLQKTAHKILFEGRKLLSIRTHKNTVYIDIE
jgi:hypothetical protein